MFWSNGKSTVSSQSQGSDIEEGSHLSEVERSCQSEDYSYETLDDNTKDVDDDDVDDVRVRSEDDDHGDDNISPPFIF